MINYEDDESVKAWLDTAFEEYILESQKLLQLVLDQDKRDLRILGLDESALDEVQDSISNLRDQEHKERPPILIEVEIETVKALFKCGIKVHSYGHLANLMQTVFESIIASMFNELEQIADELDSEELKEQAIQVSSTTKFAKEILDQYSKTLGIREFDTETAIILSSLMNA